MNPISELLMTTVLAVTVTYLLAWSALGRWVRDDPTAPPVAREVHASLQSPYLGVTFIVVATAYTLHGATIAAAWTVGLLALWAVCRPAAETSPATSTSTADAAAVRLP